MTAQLLPPTPERRLQRTLGRALRGRPPISPLRRLTALTLVAVGAVHIPVTPEHLHEAPYVGCLFIALTVVTFSLAVAVLSTDAAAVWTANGAVCALAVLGYALTRLIAFPGIGDDVGNWLEPLGVAALVLETATVGLSLSALGRRRAVRRGRP